MKVAITGTTSGFGLVLKECFEGHGDTVVSIDKEDFDLSTIHGIEGAILHLHQLFSFFDLIINNAGILILHEDRYALKEVVPMVNLNLLAVHQIMEAAPRLLNTTGNIINIASVSGLNSDPDTPLYGATKAGVISLTKSFAKLYAPKIRVNCISPGFHSTNLVPAALPQKLLDKVPMKYEGRATGIIPVVQCILDSPYMTGANIVLDGGLSL
uniref:Putative SDR family NAD(P)-dependent oxidoreductase n=1 Tax=viral metagenome TaxID=1070528 RepID=A0A6M3KJU9_9ZZZZ